MMERRVRGNSHARCEAGEKVESGAGAPLRPYLSLSHGHMNEQGLQPQPQQRAKPQRFQRGLQVGKHGL